MKEACPVSVDNPAKLWQDIIANTASTVQLRSVVRMTEAAGSWHMANSKSYLAAAQLLQLREMGLD